jgi:hypothetical protein
VFDALYVVVCFVTLLLLLFYNIHIVYQNILTNTHAVILDAILVDVRLYATRL